MFMIYLDYSANTPVASEALETYLEIERNFPGNPNAAHSLGRAAAGKLQTVTAALAQALQVQPEELIYTSGASEANNLAIKGICRMQRHYGRHILTTPLEHPSVSGPITYLQEQGYEVDLLDIGRDGRIDLDSLRDLIREDTVLVAVCAVDSELGTIQPIQEIAELVGRYPHCKLHVDATQAIGKIPFSFAGTDTASLAAHKFYGPNGVGLLYKQKDLVLEPLIHGGTGASLYRSGTPTLALAAAMEKALEMTVKELPERTERVSELNRRLRAGLIPFPKVQINSPADAVPHILNLSVVPVKGLDFQSALDEKEICVSVKSACSVPGTPSRAVFAVSRDRKRATCSWRISLSHLTTDAEIDIFMDRFGEVYQDFFENDK